jgi:hypothetical protein
MRGTGVSDQTPAVRPYRWFELKPGAARAVGSSMSTPDPVGKAGLFSPLAKALFDQFTEAVVLFDTDGRVTYANRWGRELLDSLTNGDLLDTRSLLPRLGRMGGRVERLAAGEVSLGNAVYVPVQQGAETLARREREAIVGTLNATGWRLTETARRLGISRTTLWRRLREWNVEPPRDPDGS